MVSNRVRRINIATPEITTIGLAILILGTIVFFVAGVIIATLTAWAFPLPFSSPVSSVVRVAYFLLLSIIASFVWSIWYDRKRHKKLMASAPGRVDRLRKIVNHPEGRKRLPHRCLEYYIYTSLFTTRRLRLELTSMNPRELILIVPKGQTPPWPIRFDLAFEPIETMQSDEHAASVAKRLFLSEESDDPTAEQVREHNRAIFWRHLLRLFVWILMLAGFGFGLLEPLLRGQFPSGTLLIFLAIFVITVMYGSLFRETKWWIAPGALLCRQTAPFSGKLLICRYTSRDSTMMIDLNVFRAFVVSCGRCRILSCSAVGAWLVLAGWLSNLSPPTPDEVRHFLGDVSRPREPSTTKRLG